MKFPWGRSWSRPWRYGWLGVIGLLIALLLNVAPSASLQTSRAVYHSPVRALPLPGDPPALAQIPERTASLVAQDWDQGYRHYQAGRYSAAIREWQQVMETYLDQGQSLPAAMVLNHISTAWQQLRNWSAAQRALDKGQTLLNRQSQEAETLIIQAQTLNTQGNLQFAQGNAQAALQTWQQAAPLYQRLQDDVGWMGNQINQAQALQTLGFYFKARKILQTLSQSLPQQSDLEVQMAGARSLGNALYLIGDFEGARAALQQSLQLAHDQAHPAQYAAQLSLGNVLFAEAQGLQALGNPETHTVAIQAKLRDAHRASAVAAQSPRPNLRVSAQLNQLNLWMAEAKPEAAIALWPQIDDQINTLPSGRSAIAHRITLARSLAELKQVVPDLNRSWTEIAQMLVLVRQEAQTLEDSLSQGQALGQLAHVYELNRQWEDAIQVTEQALQLSHQASADELIYQWHWQLGRIYKAQGNRTPAIAAYQQAFQTLQSLRQDLVATRPDAQFSFRKSVEPVYRELVDLLLQPSATAEIQDLREAQSVIEALQTVELENFFRSACLKDREVPLQEIEQQDAAAIYPILLDDRLEVIIGFPDKSLHHYSVPVDRATVRSQVAQLRQHLEEPIISPAAQDIGAQMYDWLVRPALPLLKAQEIRTLVFVLDGTLRNLPMATLYDGHQYLIETYSVAMTPGLQLLNPQPLTRQKLKLLAAGLGEGRHGLSPLQYVRRELASIQALWPTEILLDQDFTTTALQDQTQDIAYPIVHLATHGFFSSKVGQTYLAAWDRHISVGELSDLLRSSEQRRVSPIELLVLSACQTAKGDEQAALGLAGVAIQAGARSTFASLWNVEDQSGAQFMAAFYAALKQDGTNKAEAVRQAQLSLLDDPDYRAPRYWAPYVLLGNWL